jgi:hypothetical protein
MQNLMALCAVGVEGWIDFTLKDPNLPTKYYLRGAKRLNTTTKAWAALAGSCSWPTDHVLTSLMEDDRFADRLPELLEVFGEALTIQILIVHRCP